MSGGRIAYLCLETPRKGQASHTHVHEIIDGLTAAGWQVELIATSAGGSASGSRYWRRAVGYIGAQIRLIGQAGRYQAVYMRAHFAALPASIWLRLIGKPVVQEINGRPDDVFVTYPWLRWLGAAIKASYRWQMRMASHVIAVTEGLRRWAEAECGHARVSLVPNGANTDLFTPRTGMRDMSGRYAVFVGGLVAWHGLASMIAAIDRPEWPEGVALVIVGDGVERDRVRSVEGHPRLRWLGRVPYEEVPDLLRHAIAALCVIENPDGRSATGVAPLKLFEAMASGIPVIVSDLPFQSEVIRQQDAGLVVPVADPAALAQAVATLAAAPERAAAMGARGAEYVRNHASWRIRADETARIIESAVRHD